MATSDKQKMKSEIDELIQESNRLQSRIEQIQREQEEEQSRNRQLEREINELNIQLSSNKVAGIYGAGLDDPRIQELRDDIARRQVQISQAQREYKELLENPPKRPTFAEQESSRRSSPQRGHPALGPSPSQMLKLEGELAEIKKMLQIQQREQSNAMGASDAAAGIAAFDRMYGDDVAIGGPRQADLASRIDDLKDREELQRYVQQEKVIIKKAQEKLTMCRQQYKKDK